MVNLDYNSETSRDYSPLVINNDNYVLIGSVHNEKLSENDIMKINDSLEKIVALKMEGGEQIFDVLDPMSTEVIVKKAAGSIPVSYISRFHNGENIGQKLLNYNVPEEVMELHFALSLMETLSEEMDMDQFPILLESFILNLKDDFSYFNPGRAIGNFYDISIYWEGNNLDTDELFHFGSGMGDFRFKVENSDIWAPDLKRFREEHDGKIAVCSGMNHTPFIQTVLDGKEYAQPDWEMFLDEGKVNYENHGEELIKDTTSLKRTYNIIQNILKLN